MNNENKHALQPAAQKLEIAATLERKFRSGGKLNGDEWRRARRHSVLLEKADPFVDHLKPMVLVSLNTGLRQGELFALTWGEIDLVKNILYVRAAAAKGKKPRHIPLNAKAREVFVLWQKQSDDDAVVLPGRWGAHFNNVRRSWSVAAAAAALTDFRWHRFAP